MAASASGAVDGRLQAPDGVRVDGSANASTTSGTLNVLSPSILDAHLVADRTDIRIEWDEGTFFQGSDGAPITRHSENRGVDRHDFTSSEISLLEEEDPQQIAVFDDPPLTLLRDQQDGSLDISTAKNKTIAKWGHRADAGTLRDVGFYHTLQDPHIALTSADQAKVTGNFTLFVNNVTIDVTNSDQGQWTNWTGYRESNPSSPAGPLENPGAKEYEIRATTIHVTNGTLWVNATDAVDLYAKEANASVNGSITAPSVSGELLSHPLRYEYNDDPLRLFGDGSLNVGLAADDASRKPMQAPGTTTTTPPLELAPSGGFDVQQTQGVEVSQAETTTAWNPASWFDGDAWLALAFLATAVAGVAVGATVPERAHWVLGAAVEGWREKQYKRWGREAKLAIEDDDYDRAETLAARATRLIPDAQGAWMTLAIAQFATQTPERALSTLRQAHAEVDRLSKEFLDLWITYALDLDEPEEAIQAWFQLAKTAPQRALMMYVDEVYEVFQGDPRVREKVEQIKADLLAENPEMAGIIESIGNASRDDEDEDEDPGPEIA